MRIKRFAPLVNVLYGLVAAGEAIGEAHLGDINSAVDSITTATLHLAWGLSFLKKDGNDINGLCAFSNFSYALTDLLLTRIYCFRPSTSITRDLSLAVNIIQIGTNSLEAYMKKGQE